MFRCPAEDSACTPSMLTNTCACAPLGSLCSNYSTQYSPPLCRNIAFQVHGYNSFKSVCSTSKLAVVHSIVYTNMF